MSKMEKCNLQKLEPVWMDVWSSDELKKELFTDVVLHNMNVKC